MKLIILAIVVVAGAQSASAGPIDWPDQVMPLVLTHPEFFGIGDQQQTSATGGSWQGQQGSDGPNGHHLSLSDDTTTSQQDDDGTQSGGQNHGQIGSGRHFRTGPTDDGFTLTSRDSETSNSADLFSVGDVAFDAADVDVVQTGAAPIPEPASFVLVLSALLGVALASPRGRYPARRYCTASSRRNK